MIGIAWRGIQLPPMGIADAIELRELIDDGVDAELAELEREWRDGISESVETQGREPAREPPAHQPAQREPAERIAAEYECVTTSMDFLVDADTAARMGIYPTYEHGGPDARRVCARCSARWPDDGDPPHECSPAAQ